MTLNLQNICMLNSGQWSFIPRSSKRNVMYHSRSQLPLLCFHCWGCSFPRAAPWVAAVRLFVRSGHEPYCKLIFKKGRGVGRERAENHPAKPTIFLPPGTTGRVAYSHTKWVSHGQWRSFNSVTFYNHPRLTLHRAQEETGHSRSEATKN